jgi:hypothetical protein
MSERRRISVVPLDDAYRLRAKAAFTTRRVPREAMRTVVSGAIRPRSGDLVLAKVVQLGHHKHIEQPNGRRAMLLVGDSIIVAYGDRYATDQFESQVPGNLHRAQLVASGGIASSVLSRSRVVRPATEIEPIGLLGDENGVPLNLSAFALEPVPIPASRPPTVAVLGTSMNSGKTTTIRFMVEGLSRSGVRVGATKVTGTGSGNDYWCMIDAGVHRMLDFTDVGLASTYLQPMDLLERKLGELVNHLTASDSQVNLVEVADGIFQGETSRLLESAAFRSLIDAVIFAAPDSMGAYAGVSHLRAVGHEVLAVSGLINRSPLAVREAEAATGLAVLGEEQLTDGAVASQLLGLGLVEPPAAAEAPSPAAIPLAPASGNGSHRHRAGETGDEELVRPQQLYVSSDQVQAAIAPERRP